VLRAAAVAVLAAAAALLVVAAASARIVPQRSIAGVRLGAKPATVRAVLGRPTRVRTGTNDFGVFREFIYPALRVTFVGDENVTSVTTTRRSERTAAGVGVGSTEAQVKAHVAGVRCKTEFGTRHCFVGQFLAGRRVTDFFIRRGRVSRVTLGFVLD
jgi:hypothetical protein